jgi:hypothetical protein
MVDAWTYLFGQKRGGRDGFAHPRLSRKVIRGCFFKSQQTMTLSRAFY